MLQFFLTDINLSNTKKNKNEIIIEKGLFHKDEMLFSIDSITELSSDSAPTMRSPSPDRNGLLRFEGRATRAGIFDYRRADGTIKKVLRRPSVVKEYAKTVANSIITTDHPSVPITIDNGSDLAVGLVTGNVIWEENVEDGYVRVQGVVYNKDAAESILSGEKSELSCGYFADHIVKAGTWTNHAGVEMHYDEEMVNLQNNHLAHVSKGRAGPESRIQTDNKEPIAIELINHSQRKKMPIKFTKGKVRDYNLDEDLAIQRAVLDLEEDLTTSEEKILEQATEIQVLKDAKFQLETAATLSGEADVVKDTSIVELTAEVSRLKSIEVTDADIQARTELLEMAKDLKLDSVETMSSFEIKKAIVAVKLPSLTADAEDFNAKVEMGYQMISDAKMTVSPLEKAVGNLLNSETVEDESDEEELFEDAAESIYAKNMFGAQ